MIDCPLEVEVREEVLAEACLDAKCSRENGGQRMLQRKRKTREHLIVFLPSMLLF